MRSFIGLFLAAAALLALPSEAADIKEPCLRLSEIVGALNGTLRDSHTAIVSTTNGEKFLVGMSGWCHDLDMTAVGVSGMCLKSGDWIAAKGDPVKYTFGNVTKSTGSRCFIAKVQAYTAAMQQADAPPNH